MSENIKIPSWDEFFFKQVYLVALKSKDKRTKIGSVLVRWKEKDVISVGYNGFPRLVNDDIEERHERPEKYFWVCHSETNCILNCARNGRLTKGTILFTQGLPCADCSKNIIQAGIRGIVIHKQWIEYEKKFNWEKWIDSGKRSKIMFDETNIGVRIFDGVLGAQGFLDGKVIEV